MSDSNTPSHGHASGSHFQPSLSVVLIIVVLFVGATFLMVRAASPSTSGTTTTTVANSSGTTTTTTTPTNVHLAKSKVRVQVANGTNVSQLAGHYTQILQTKDWDTLPPGNTAHVAATVIYYNPGFRDYALEIAGTIKVMKAAVVPLNGQNPIAGSATDDVIVVLGPNSAIK